MHLIGAKTGFSSGASRTCILSERAAKRIDHRADPAFVGENHIVMFDQFDRVSDRHAFPCAKGQNTKVAALRAHDLTVNMPCGGVYSALAADGRHCFQPADRQGHAGDRFDGARDLCAGA